MEGNRIAYYPSLTDAGQATGIQSSHIGAVARGLNKSANGYFWVKGNGEEKIDLSDQKWGSGSMNAARLKKVKQYTTEGIYIQTFNNAKDAAAFVGVSHPIMKSACRGNQKTCKGYKWRYASGS